MKFGIPLLFSIVSRHYDFFKIQVAANLQGFVRHHKVVNVLKINSFHNADLNKVSYCIHTDSQILLDRAQVTRLTRFQSNFILGPKIEENTWSLKHY